MFSTMGVIFIVVFFFIIAGTIMIKRFDGTNIFVLGKKDISELLFGAGYILLLYIILSNACALPMPNVINRFFWHIEIIRLIGIAFCCLGIGGYIICTITF